MRFDASQPLVFLHIRKTGGMSFTEIVSRQYPDAYAWLRGDTVEECLDGWNAIPVERRARVRCISGHVPFGIDTLLGRPATYLTLFRDPVERFASAYYFYLRRPDALMHRVVVERRLSFEAFAESEEAAREHDGHIRVIAGPTVAPGEPEDPLARAKKRIEQRFALVGLMERFDETALLARRVFGWTNVFYMKINQNKQRPPAIPASTRAVIEERSAKDIELYRWGRARFEAMLAEHGITDEELRRYRAVNRVYGLAKRVVGLPRALVNDALAARKRRLIAREAASGRSS